MTMKMMTGGEKEKKIQKKKIAWKNPTSRRMKEKILVANPPQR